jgi:hypothetical protein
MLSNALPATRIPRNQASRWWLRRCLLPSDEVVNPPLYQAKLKQVVQTQQVEVPAWVWGSWPSGWPAGTP